ncbi:MAG: DUF2752 domain-containing protein [Flavobacteriales bacterium]|nr:DUF2752 domain-containing protein [Flavobacteriales bacterium]MCX7767810.1 DUF2752 domain-containing protein [Flavobacteriales bacterium]MDW8409789.1 DUF2752 domain-containing protein [Flavobacteriales bacterium]
MLPCPSKALWGLECPGCGLQRAVWALWEGRILDSLMLYPALIPMLVTVSILAGVVLLRWRGLSRILLSLYILDSVLIYGNFLLKWLV